MTISVNINKFVKRTTSKGQIKHAKFAEIAKSAEFFNHSNITQYNEFMASSSLTKTCSPPKLIFSRNSAYSMFLFWLYSSEQKNRTFYFFTTIHESQDCSGREMALLQLLITNFTCFTDTQILPGQLLQRAHLCIQEAAGLKPGTFGFRAQVANH